MQKNDHTLLLERQFVNSAYPVEPKVYDAHQDKLALNNPPLGYFNGDDMLKSLAKAMLVLGFVVAYLILLFSFVAYFKSRIGNLVWNNTTLDNFTFISTLRARDYLWIYLTNIIAIALTFGLATPWAQVRLARYRASKLQILGDVDFDQFVGNHKEEVKATGEEIADFFDVDFSFG